MITGFLLIDKAQGPTSHDVVQAVRAITGERRVGHTGTLDPMATGLLPVCLGRATRLARFVAGSTKTYSAVMRFGFATDTYDATGRRMGDETPVSLDRDELMSVLASFVGRQEQVPPPFAAKKVEGRRMYELARAGIPFVPKAVEVVIRGIELLDVEGNKAALRIDVESGTYIRSLAHDLGLRLGCGAHLEQLRRTRVGPLGIEQALSLEELEMHSLAGRLHEQLMAPAHALSELPGIHLNLDEKHKIRHGRSTTIEETSDPLPQLSKEQPLRLLDTDGDLVAVGMMDDDLVTIRPIVVLQVGDSGQTAKTSSGRPLQAKTRVV